MPPFRRTAASSLPTLVSLTKLVHLIPKRSSEWTIQAANTLAMSGPPPIEPEDPPDSPAFWWKLGLSVVFVLSGGVFAGLTLALMGSDDLNLRVLSASSSDPKERKAANKVLRLLGRGRHWVLVVLLLSNVIVNESLPIFLDDVLGGGLYAVIVSTTMIVIFGEIIPQAICVRYGLAIGGACAPMVWFFMILFSPIAWPTAKLLDYILGADEGHTYKKAELKSFLQFHREGEEPLRDDEIAILNGVLSLNEKHAKEIMTPIKDCLTLPADKVLDHDAIDQILLSGFSRIPIYEPGQTDNFVGMLLVKRLITYNPDDEWPVSKFNLLPLPEAKPEINCFQALDYFQTGRAHLLLISETPGQKGGALGIVSLEDLIEEIIGEEIVDETDRYEDNHSKKIVKRSGPAAVMRGIIERRRVINAFSRRPSNPGTAAPTVTATNTTDGILVQIDNGNLIAEPVGFSGEPGNDGKDSVTVDQSQRLVIGTDIESLATPAAGVTNGPSAAGNADKTEVALMSTIEETSPTDNNGPDIKVDSVVVDDKGEQESQDDSAAAVDAKGEAEAETKGKGDVEGDGEGEGEGGGSGSGTVSGSGSGTTTPREAEPLLKSSESQTNGAAAAAGTGAGGGESKNKKKKKKKAKKANDRKAQVNTMSEQEHGSDMPHPTATGLAQTSETRASVNFEYPYETHDAFERAAKGFMARYAQGSDTAGAGRPGPGPDRTNGGWEWREHRFVPHQGYMYRRVTRYLPTAGAPVSGAGDLRPDLDLGRLGVDDIEEAYENEREEAEEMEEMDELIEEEDDAVALPSSRATGHNTSGSSPSHTSGPLRKIDIEQHVVYSATYGSAMFCFRAWDATGAPLPIPLLLQLAFLRPSPGTGAGAEPAPEPGSFAHQTDSIMLDASSPFPLVQSTEHPTTRELVFSVHPCRIGPAVGEILGAETTARGKEMGVMWLGTFMMLTNRVVDLTYP